jgi:hypothetical protein
MLFLTVNGQGPGATLGFSGRRPERLKIRAEAVTAGALDRLEIVSRGRVIKTVVGSGRTRKLVAEFESSFNDTGWLVARCFERPDKTSRFAHTSPVYLQFGERGAVISADVRFFLDWLDREIAYYEQQPGFKVPEHREEMLSFLRRARAVYSRLVGGNDRNPQ